MKEKKIEIGVDQFTLVLQATDQNFEFDDWRSDIAEKLILEFLKKSRMEILFGLIAEADVHIPDGYTTGYSFPNSPFYFCIAYHEAFSKMGIIVKFSAYSWQEYQKQYEHHYQEPLHVHTFFKLIDSNNYNFRLSRIDPCIDFFNYNIDIAQLKRSIQSGRTEIRYGKY